MDNRPELMLRRMPSSVIIANFVCGIDDCNYELFLRELLNGCKYFLDRGGSIYEAPESEENGQCDAIASNYEIDFKLLASQTELRAASIFNLQPFVANKGLAFFTSPKVSSGSATVTRIHAALRGISEAELEAMRSTSSKGTDIHNDIARIIQTAEVKKNILYLFPYNLMFDKPLRMDDAVEIIRKSLTDDFSTLFLYRNKVNPGFDTFLTTNYEDAFLIFRSDQGRLNYIDAVPVTQMPTYCKLVEYSKPF